MASFFAVCQVHSRSCLGSQVVTLYIFPSLSHSHTPSMKWCYSSRHRHYRRWSVRTPGSKNTPKDVPVVPQVAGPGASQEVRLNGSEAGGSETRGREAGDGGPPQRWA